MKTEIFSNSEEVAKRAAEFLEEKIRETINTKGSFSMAISGGRTPWEMLKFLSKAHLRWNKINIFQVDEREAPDGHPDRNLSQLFKAIQDSGVETKVNIFPMPVTAENLEEACEDYSKIIYEVTGDGILDLIHLGMGSDGHTASLIPGDQVCEIEDRDVAMTLAPYQGRMRMTLTYPIINRAKEILWVVTGEEKAEMVEKLLISDPSIPAGNVNSSNAVLLLDKVAARIVEKA
jgi:6-phosphogluconolactonase